MRPRVRQGQTPQSAAQRSPFMAIPRQGTGPAIRTARWPRWLYLRADFRSRPLCDGRERPLSGGLLPCL